MEYIQQSRAFQLVEKAEGWQLATDPSFAQWVRQLFPAPKPARLSAPALETLAIIAYRQPITRADVEAVRGVNIDGVLQTLMERGLVKIAGRAEIPGRPLLYETTQFFLDHFGLRNLDELPNVEELRRRYLPVGATCSRHRRCRQRQGHRPRLQREMAVASIARVRVISVSSRSSEWLLLVTLRHSDNGYTSAIFACYVCVCLRLPFAEINVSRLRARREIFREQARRAMLVMQNGRTIFEHYANGGSANRRWPIFSGTKSFWGIAALAAVQDGLVQTRRSGVGHDHRMEERPAQIADHDPAIAQPNRRD